MYQTAGEKIGELLERVGGNFGCGVMSSGFVGLSFKMWKSRGLGFYVGLDPMAQCILVNSVNLVPL